MQISKCHQLNKAKQKTLSASFSVGQNTQHDLFCHCTLVGKAIGLNSSLTSDNGNALTESSCSELGKPPNCYLLVSW